jgi:RIO-like serine/threonine protein kinase
VPCGITHGDFAPWNTSILDDQLFVFDWESAERQSPHLWDEFHFQVQAASLLHVHNRHRHAPQRDRGDRALYLLYLLHSVCKHVEEEAPRTHIALTCRRNLLTQELSA